MSNALAIAGVTAVLKDLLDNGLVDAGVGEVSVTARPPDKISTEDGEPSQLNLFLYRVEPNQGWRNVGLPSVNGAGDARLTNPPLALDLHYLLTAYGSTNFEGEILLGYAMQVLHENPTLDRQAIRDALAAGAVSGDVLPAPLQTLAAAELADQAEQVKLVPETLSNDEISKLWTAFGAKYRPTAAYLASVVLIESKRSTRASLPVRERRLFVVPFREPRVDAVTAEAGPDVPIVSGTRLLVTGKRLAHVPMEVLIAGLPGTIVEEGEERLLVDQPAGLEAGVHTLQDEHPFDFGTPNEPHSGVESNVAAFLLRPELGGWALSPAPAGPGPYTGEATLTITPAVPRTQKVTLLLNSTTGGDAYSFPAETRAADADPIVAKLAAVARGDYFVRVRVDGAESPIELDPADPAFGPVETV